MARTKHGLPGVYNSTAITLSNEEGAALALDSAGQVITSPPVTPNGDSLIDDTVDAYKVTQATGLKRTIDTMSVAHATDVIMSNKTELTPKFAAIAASSNGNNTIVAAVTGKKIRVIQFKLSSSGTVNWKWQSGAGVTDLTGLTYAVANTLEAGIYNPVGHFETAAGSLLNLNLSAATAVGGYVVYVEV